MNGLLINFLNVRFVFFTINQFIAACQQLFVMFTLKALSLPIELTGASNMNKVMYFSDCKLERWETHPDSYQHVKVGARSVNFLEDLCRA